MSNNETLSGGDLTRTAARWFMGARGGLEVTRADMQNARCLLGDLLAAVADDLEAHYDITKERLTNTDGWLYSEDRAYLDGIEAAAERVRDLLRKDGK